MESENEQVRIEREFSQSWDWMERFYEKRFPTPDWGWLKPMLPFIAELRQRGYDKKFRAGQSLWMFVLSRSKTHGLRRDQACLRINPRADGTMELDYFENGVKVQKNIDRIQLTPEVEELLARLLSHPID